MNSVNISININANTTIITIAITNTNTRFIKLALEYNCSLVPMYLYGENEVYINSHFMLGFRKFLQKNFQIGYIHAHTNTIY